MKIVLQVDRDFRDNVKFSFFCKSISHLIFNKNDYDLYVDHEKFISLVDLKVKKLRSILNNYDDDEVIMYLDAFDTIVVASNEEIEKKFISMDVDVVYSVESNCSPSKKLEEHFEMNKFINTGGIIFRNGVYKKILSLLDNSDVDSAILNNDQYLHQVFAIPLLNKIRIKLDTDNEIFQSLYYEDVSNFRKVNNKIINRKSSKHPCVFHGNGCDGFTKINTFYELFIKN